MSPSSNTLTWEVFRDRLEHILATQPWLRWLSKRWLPVWLGLAFFVSGVPWLFSRGPMFPFEYTPALVSSSFLTLGFLSIPAQWIYSLIAPHPLTTFELYTFSFSSPVNHFYIDLFLLAALSVLVTFGLWRIQAFRQINNALRTLFAVNMLLAWVVAVLSLQGTPTPDANYVLRNSCDFSISDATTIRAQYFASSPPASPDGFGPNPAIQGTEYFLTHDNGQQWQPFLKISDWQGTCDQIDHLNSNSIWLYASGAFAVTHDGGQNWNGWTVEQVEQYLPPNWRDRTQYTINITDVMFTDEMQGAMTVDYSQFGQAGTQVLKLATTDGGLSWHIAA